MSATSEPSTEHRSAAAPGPNLGRQRQQAWLWVYLYLLATALVLVLTWVPGVFTVDEDNYLVTVIGLRDGSFRLNNTAGLAPSDALIYFEPNPQLHPVTSTPVVSSAPPLYAFFALPFAYLFGWPGLLLLNVIAFVLLQWLLYRYVLTATGSISAAWLAMLLCGLGSYMIEYAQGAWPQMLSTTLVFASIACTSAARRGLASAAVAAGALGGLAAGVRYPNIVFVLANALLLLLWSHRRLRHAALYALGAAGPLATSTLINGVRLGVFNPVTKGRGYYRHGPAQPFDLLARLREAGHVLLARLFDSSTRPPLGEQMRRDHPYLRHAESGALLVGSAVKKAWAQSAPWIAFGFIGLLSPWVGRDRASQVEQEQRLLSLPVLLQLGLFAAFGFSRFDGLSYNQRYLMELVPLVSAAAAMELHRRELINWKALALGATAIALLFPYPLFRLGWQSELGQLLLTKVPLLLFLGLLLLGLWNRVRLRKLLSALLGAALAWGLTAHLVDDVRASRATRSANARRLELIGPHLPGKSVLVTFWGNKDAFGPLQLSKDVVILDSRNDPRGTLQLIDALLEQQQRRVFVPFPRHLPPPLLRALVARWQLSRVPGSPMVEVRRRAAPAAG